MSYYFNTIIQKSFEESITLVMESLKSEGFGIVSEINMTDKFKEKLGVDFKRYLILGACNPGFAYKAVQAEEKIGTMLPCNVVVIEQGELATEVVAINPTASMMAVQNEGLISIANEVTERLQRVIASLPQ